MFTVSNVLSFLRGPLAFLFLITQPEIRAVAILLAMISDSIDGYLARRYSHPTKLGAVLDPLMDKFFVFFVLYILFTESKIESWQVYSMLTRDVAICIFGLFLISTRRLKDYSYSSIKWGKITTALQFCVLFLLSLGYTLPPQVYYLFFAIGGFVLIELFMPLAKSRSLS